jgi:exonuclease VII small subunit
MMSDLLRRGEALASQGQQQRLQAVAQQLRALFGSAAVQVEEPRCW